MLNVRKDPAAQLRKQKRKRQAILSPLSTSDLVEINSLGAFGYRKALRFITTGELVILETGKQRFATRGELTNWEIIDYGCDVTPAGQFLGDG